MSSAEESFWFQLADKKQVTCVHCFRPFWFCGEPSCATTSKHGYVLYKCPSCLDDELRWKSFKASVCKGLKKFYDKDSL